MRFIDFFLLFTTVFCFFIGIFYFKNAKTIYESQKAEANDFFKRLNLKLTSPKIIKFSGFFLMLYGIVGFIVIILKLISNLFMIP